MPNATPHATPDTDAPAPVVTYPLHAILTKQQVAAMLQLKDEASVDKLNLPAIPVLSKTRYLCSQVLDELESRARRVA